MSDIFKEAEGGVEALFNQELDVQHHDVYERHEFGKSFPIPGVPAANGYGVSAKPGSALGPARADHTHGGWSVPGVPSMVVQGTSSSQGSAAAPARGDHIHGLASIAASARSASIQQRAGNSYPSIPANTWTTVDTTQVSFASVTYTRYFIAVATALFQPGASNAYCGVNVYFEQSNLPGTWNAAYPVYIPTVTGTSFVSPQVTFMSNISANIGLNFRVGVYRYASDIGVPIATNAFPRIDVIAIPVDPIA